MATCLSSGTVTPAAQEREWAWKILLAIRQSGLSNTGGRND